MVVNPGVSGKTTVKLNEVPWDQALDLILKTNGLGYTHEDNVLRIAPIAALQAEEQAKRKLQEEKQLAGDLVDFTKTISYAKADEMQGVLKAGRSALGAGTDQHRQADQHADHQGPARLRRAREGAHR